jgi:hypothetical protein
VAAEKTAEKLLLLTITPCTYNSIIHVVTAHALLPRAKR